MRRCQGNRILVLLIAAFGSFNQLVAQPYYFKHHQVENGLSNNSVQCILQDNDGFLWFGTLNGLKRFDGGRATFYRKIKALSNLTPHELINIARLKKAAEFLAKGNYKIYEVANMVGYTLQTNFARDFHKQFGMTPTEYLNNRKPGIGLVEFPLLSFNKTQNL